MILVNKTHLVEEKQLPIQNFRIVKAVDQQDVLIDSKTYQSFQQLQKHLEKKGIIIGIDGAYRSFRRQAQLYREFVEKYGKDYADQFVAPVGASEHHTGLAIDISLKEKGRWLSQQEDAMRQDAIFPQIHEELARFGFILRYPKGKEKITNYPYEPWHIRYVGKKIADDCRKHQLTLEEYVQKKLCRKEKGCR